MKTNAMKKIIIAMASVGLLVTVGTSAALTLSPGSSQQISINVISGCVVTAPPAFVFPSIPLAAVAPVSVSMGNATITCTGASAITDLGIDAGLYNAGTVRRMADGTAASFVSYTISTTSGGADIGTTGLAGVVANPYAQPMLVNAGATSIAIFGNLTAASTPTLAGLHTDTVNYYVDF